MIWPPVRDNEKTFHKYAGSKRRAEDSLHHLLNTEGSVVTKDDEKADVLNAFFVTVFNINIRCPQNMQPSELEVRNRELSEAQISQEEVVSDCYAS